LLGALLAKDPSQRPDAQTVVQELASQRSGPVADSRDATSPPAADFGPAVLPGSIGEQVMPAEVAERTPELERFQTGARDSPSMPAEGGPTGTADVPLAVATAGSAAPGHHPETATAAEMTKITWQDPVSRIPVAAAPPAAPRKPAPSRKGRAVRRRWVIIATGAAIAAVIGIIAVTLLLPGKPVTGSRTLDVRVVGPLAAVGGMQVQVLQNNTTLTQVVSGTLSPNAEGTELEWNSKLSPGTYQVCVEPTASLKVHRNQHECAARLVLLAGFGRGADVGSLQHRRLG
jgi:hypothetical protein